MQVKEYGIYKSIRRLKKDLAPMSWKERIEHIWINYWETILIAFILIVVVGSMLSNYLTNRKEILMGGIAVNVPLSEEGVTYLVTDYSDTFGVDSRDSEVELLQTSISKLDDTANYESNYYTITQTIAMMTDEEVDYLILDKTALEIYLAKDAFMDLREIFDDKALNAFGEKLIKLTKVNDAGETIDTAYPVAIEISSLPFIQDCAETEDSVYIGFVENSPNKERLNSFWNYLTNWKDSDR